MQVTKTLQEYSKLIQARKSSAKSRTGKDVLYTILSDLNGSEFANNVAPIITPGEVKFDLYNSYDIANLTSIGSMDFLPQNIIEDNDHDLVKIKEHIKLAKYSWLWNGEVADFNARGALKYRTQIGSSILREEDANFQTILGSELKLKSSIVNTSDYILGRALTTLVERSQAQIFLEINFSKISQKVLIGYILLITNFVFDAESLASMKDILREGCQHPHVDYKTYFTEWTTAQFFDYIPFQSKSNWNHHDVEFIEECFIGPQTILSKKLIEFIAAGEKKLKQKNLKQKNLLAMVGYLVGKEWLEILKLTGSHVKSTKYMSEVFPSINSEVAKAMPQKPAENIVSPTQKFKSNLNKFAEMLGVLICESGIFQFSNDFKTLGRTPTTQTAAWLDPTTHMLSFTITASTNPGCNKKLMQHAHWTVSQIAQLVLLGKVFKTGEKYRTTIGDDFKDKTMTVRS